MHVQFTQQKFSSRRRTDFQPRELPDHGQEIRFFLVFSHPQDVFAILNIIHFLIVVVVVVAAASYLLASSVSLLAAICLFSLAEGSFLFRLK